jgi:hypothetical protein
MMENRMMASLSFRDLRLTNALNTQIVGAKVPKESKQKVETQK